MPGQYCGNDDTICYPQIKCVDKYCKGKSEGDLCSDNQDLSCDVGLACIKDAAKEEYNCQKQLEVQQACENDIQCRNDALCVGKVCLGLLSIDNDIIVKGECDQYAPNMLLNNVCKSAQCTTYNSTHFKCIKGYTTDTAMPKEATYLKQCASITDDYVEYTFLNCSFSQHDSKHYCGAHLGDEKGLKMTQALNTIKSQSQNICHTSKRFDPTCWYNNLYESWEDFRNYYSLRYEFLYYPQLENSDKCTQYVYFNEYYNINYVAKDTYEEKGDNANILSLIFFILIIIL